MDIEDINVNKILDDIESNLYRSIIESDFFSANAYCHCYNVVAIEGLKDVRACMYKINSEIGWEYKIMPVDEYYKFITTH